MSDNLTDEINSLIKEIRKGYKDCYIKLPDEVIEAMREDENE